MMINYDKIGSTVTYYPRRFSEGFLDSEIEDLLEDIGYPEKTKCAFFKALNNPQVLIKEAYDPETSKPGKYALLMPDDVYFALKAAYFKN